MSLREHFPFKEIRTQQAEALDRLESTADKKFSIYELPTGSGKSGIAMAVVNESCSMCVDEAGGYILTPQLALTAQYMADFGDSGLRELKGKSNYGPCNGYKTDCEKAHDLHCSHKGKCTEYYPARERAIEVPTKCTVNYKAFLSSNLPPRQVLVLDEGHNIEDAVLDFVGSKVTRSQSKLYLGEELPLFNSTEGAKAFNWVTMYKESLKKRERFLVNQLDKYKRNTSDCVSEHQAKDFSVEMNRVNRWIRALETYLEGRPGDWFVQSDWNWGKGRPRSGDLIIKPMDVAPYARKSLFGKAKKVLIMSGTILSTRVFTSTLGIGTDEVDTRRWESNFPVANRPIVYDAVGPMDFNNKLKTRPKLVRKVAEILRRYPNEKGIIHTQSKDNMDHIVGYLDEQGMGSRIIQVWGKERVENLRKHWDSPEPTVLIGPAITEGLDLVDDLSRFQVVCKVPYPDLGDPYTMARKNRSHAWYAWRTAVTLIQGSGRSIRSESDRADTYILDSCFDDFCRKNRKLFPDWWVSAIVTRAK